MCDPKLLRDTCQGNSCLGASSPPMILPSVSVTSFPWGLARLRAHRESSTRHFMMSSVGSVADSLSDIFPCYLLTEQSVLFGLHKVESIRNCRPH